MKIVKQDVTFVGNYQRRMRPVYLLAGLLLVGTAVCLIAPDLIGAPPAVTIAMAVLFVGCCFLGLRHQSQGIKTFPCPRCGQRITRQVWLPEGADPLAEPPPEEPTGPRKLYFDCPHCQVRWDVGIGQGD